MASPILNSLRRIPSPRSAPGAFNAIRSVSMRSRPVPSRRILWAAPVSPRKLPKITLNSKPICDIDDERIGSLKNLGRGGFGSVVLGFHKGTLRAVKIIRSKGNEGIKTLEEEKNALQLLPHPNVVLTLDVITYPRKGFVIMEYFPSETLSYLTQNFVVSDDLKLRYLLDVSKALEHCHSSGILHLDVKPGNILVSRVQGISKLCDFGNSYNISQPSASWSFRGTVPFAAPEIFCNSCPSTACDVYSFGMTLWSVFHEVTPFSGMEQDRIIFQVVNKNERPRPKREVRHDVNALINQAWSSDFTKRPSLEEVTTVLSKIRQRPFKQSQLLQR